jgi:SAM-dependent methyltransferase
VLPFESNSFDAVLCIDAINHFSNRALVLDEWARVLRSNGRLVFTDPTVITGCLSNAEIATRSAIGFFLFVPPGENERLLQAAGFSVLATQNLTDGLAANAGRFVSARKEREAALRAIEGDTVHGRHNEFY